MIRYLPKQSAIVPETFYIFAPQQAETGPKTGERMDTSSYRPRNAGHNYYGRGTYLITLVVSGRERLLSRLVTEHPGRRDLCLRGRSQNPTRGGGRLLSSACLATTMVLVP